MAKKRLRGSGSIYQRESDGRWCAVVDLGWQDGWRVRKSFYAATADEVQDQLDTARDNLRKGLPVRLDRQSVADHLDTWLQDTVKASVRPLTFEQYHQHLRLYLKPSLGAVKLAKLTPAHIRSFINARLQEDLHPRTVELSLIVLRRALAQAVEDGAIAANPAKAVKAPKYEREEVTPWSPDQARTFLEAAAGERLGPLYAIALTLGLRRGEALGLRWSDVDLIERRLTVAQQVMRVGGPRVDGHRGHLEFAPVKTKKGRRTLPLPASLVDVLKAHRKRQLEERLRAGPAWKDLNLIFCTARGTPVEASALTSDFKRLIRKAGLPDKPFHGCRHAVATALLSENTHPRLVMELLGHSKISITLDTYSHVIEKSMRGVADTMDRLLSPTQDMPLRKPGA